MRNRHIRHNSYDQSIFFNNGDKIYFELQDKDENTFSFSISFKQNLEISASNITNFPKINYTNSLSLQQLKYNNMFFNMFNSIQELSTIFKEFKNTNSFYINVNYGDINLGIKKQTGMKGDVYLPLYYKASDTNELVNELIEKNRELEKKKII